MRISLNSRRLHQQACQRGPCFGLAVAWLLSASFAVAETGGSSASTSHATTTGASPTKGTTSSARPSLPMRVVLVTNQADARIMPLLRAELENLGFEVVVVDHGENEVIPRDLNAAARSTNSLAGFRVIVAEKSVEVWLADRVTGKVVLREALEQDTESKGAETVVVLRAVELLRVSFMELEAPHEARGEVDPPPEIQSVAGFHQNDGRYALEVGGVVSWLSSDLSVLPGFQLGFRMKTGKWLHWGIQAATDLATPSVSTDAGSASLGTTSFGGYVGINQKHSRGFWQPAFRLGPGLMWSRIEGRANAGFEEFDHDVWSPTLTADARLTLRPSNALRFFASAAPSLVFARPAVEIDGEKVISLSPVALRFSAGLQVAWP